jgi:hypothetical protein
MKKIVGILSAAAVLATSVFAADVSASTKINGKLFAYENEYTKDGKLVPQATKIFTENNDSHDYANPNMTFSVSDDKAGATVKLTTDGGNKEVKLTTQTIWFKPVDALKITVGNFDQALNKEQIKWTESAANLGGNGLLLSINAEGFGLDFGLEKANGKDWFTKKDGEDDPTILPFFIKAGYSADFGSIAGFVDFNHSGRDKIYAGHDYLFGGYGEAKFTPKDGAVSDIFFGAGYNNTFDGINVFVNVLGYMCDKFEWVRPEAYVAGSADALSYKLFVAPTIFLDSDYKDANDKSLDLQVLAYAQYALDATTVYARFDDVNVLAKKFTSEIRLGATGSVGGMGYNTWLQINTGKGDDQDKVDICVPFELTYNF